MRRLSFLLLLPLLPLPAAADSGMMLIGVSNRQMPYDAVSSAPTCAYSFRRLRTAYTANKAMNIVRASDSATTDIGFTAAGLPDTAAAASFCNATTCKIVTRYNQGTGTCDVTQATDANRYALTLGCLGPFPCMRATSGSIALLTAGNITPATGLVSFAAVANRSAGTGNCTPMRENSLGNRFVMISGATQWNIIGGTSGSVVANASNAVWHSSTAVMNGASSVMAIDGAETTGTATGNTTAGPVFMSGANSTTCDQIEESFWDNYALTAGERAYLNIGQRATWGF